MKILKQVLCFILNALAGPGHLIWPVKNFAVCRIRVSLGVISLPQRDQAVTFRRENQPPYDAVQDNESPGEHHPSRKRYRT